MPIMIRMQHGPQQLLQNMMAMLQLLYYAEKFYDVDDPSLDDEPSDDDIVWYEGNQFTVDGSLVVESWEVSGGIYLYGFTIIDLQGNGYYTDFIEVEFIE